MSLSPENANSPWHKVHPGDEAPQRCNAIIEIPMGSSNKYELDKKTGLLKLDRVLYSAVHYPANYGFIPQTLGDDGDPLDVLVLASSPVVPLTLVVARAIGVIFLTDQQEADHKIVAVSVTILNSITTKKPASSLRIVWLCLSAFSKTIRRWKRTASWWNTFFRQMRPCRKLNRAFLHEVFSHARLVVEYYRYPSGFTQRTRNRKRVTGG